MVDIFFNSDDTHQINSSNFKVTTANKEYDWIFENENEMRKKNSNFQKYKLFKLIKLIDHNFKFFNF